MNRAAQCLHRPQEAGHSTGSGCGQWACAGTSEGRGGRYVRLRCHCSAGRSEGGVRGRALHCSATGNGDRHRERLRTVCFSGRLHR